MRMPQLVLCVVVLALCGCGVEGFIEDDSAAGSLYQIAVPAGALTPEQNTMRMNLIYCNQYLNRERVCADWNRRTVLPPTGCLPDNILESDCKSAVEAAMATDDGREECGNIQSLEDFQNTVFRLGKVPGASADCGAAAPPPPVDAAGEDDVPAVTKKPPNNSCPYAHDGECDEPMYCG
eukprot:SAG11_NODE_10891_length_798_cov_5.512160_1_plen_178_part_10